MAVCAAGSTDPSAAAGGDVTSIGSVRRDRAGGGGRADESRSRLGWLGWAECNGHQPSTAKQAVQVSVSAHKGKQRSWRGKGIAISAVTGRGAPAFPVKLSMNEARSVEDGSQGAPGVENGMRGVEEASCKSIRAREQKQEGSEAVVHQFEGHFDPDAAAGLQASAHGTKGRDGVGDVFEDVVEMEYIEVALRHFFKRGVDCGMKCFLEVGTRSRAGLEQGPLPATLYKMRHEGAAASADFQDVQRAGRGELRGDAIKPGGNEVLLNRGPLIETAGIKVRLIVTGCFRMLTKYEVTGGTFDVVNNTIDEKMFGGHRPPT